MRGINRQISLNFVRKIGIVASLAFCFAAFGLSASAQTLLVNYDFATAVAGNPCTATPLTTASGVTSTFTTGGTGGGTCTTPAGTAAASPPAFTANAANQSVSLTSFAQGSSNFFQFQLSGVNTYQNYMLFFQNQASSSGADNIDVQYSIDGTTFTTFQTFTASASLGASGVVVDLSSVTAIENQPTVYFRILGRRVAANTSSAGTFRIDNFQVQALGPSAASATISGRVTSGLRGISKVRVMISGGDLTEPRFARTNGLGYYTFENLTAGETYILEVSAKQYRFANPTLVVNLQENLSETNFSGEMIQNGAK